MAFVSTLVAFNFLPFPWWYFPLLLFVPDVSIIGYLISPRVGAVAYNIAHHKGLALIIGGLGIAFSIPWMQLVGIIMFAHSSLDRMLGFGLKHFDSFKHTHLGNLTCIFLERTNGRPRLPSFDLLGFSQDDLRNGSHLLCANLSTLANSASVEIVNKGALYAPISGDFIDSQTRFAMHDVSHGKRVVLEYADALDTPTPLHAASAIWHHLYHGRFRKRVPSGSMPSAL